MDLDFKQHPLSQTKDVVRFIEKIRIVALEVCARQILDAAVDVTPKSLRGGNLRGSAFTSQYKNGIIIGYTASYAVYVHENIGAKFTTPGTKAKFLSSTVDAMHTQLNATFFNIMSNMINKRFSYLNRRK